jgi:hypothetical protein
MTKLWPKKGAIHGTPAGQFLHGFLIGIWHKDKIARFLRISRIALYLAYQ